MKIQDIQFLHNAWINRPRRSFPDLTSRLLLEYSRVREREWDYLSRPEFGITMAWRLAKDRETCSVLRKPPYRWIRKGVEFFETLGKPSDGDPELLAVAQADDLKSGPDGCIIVQAMLLAKDATVERVAQCLNLSSLTVAAFSDLWFNVIHRRNEPAYIRKAVETALIHPGRINNTPHVNKRDQELLHAGLNGTIDDVWRLALDLFDPARHHESAVVSQCQ